MAKKHWISVCENYENQTGASEYIIWESSSSEDERAVNDPNGLKGYITPARTQSLRSPVGILSDTCSNCSSPILKLSKCNLNSISPELTQRKQTIQDTVVSPVIQKYRFRAVKKRRKVNQELFAERERETSPDLFIPDPTLQIDSESPISDSCEPKIEPFESQFGSPVKWENNAFGSFRSLYYEPPKRKKSYKKGGLAYQLQQALKSAKCRVKIWEHEKETGTAESEDGVLRFQANQCWTEYGVTLWECGLVSVLSSSGEKETSGTFIINLGVTQILKIKFEESIVYELFPPYVVETIEYKGQCLPFYYNVSKVYRVLKQLK
ncbi:hypothetical protein D910_11737 [Dendroctonus ponderosae]|uniref:Uncharacterized protein n=1 Tax=Dendroctonus ponderosae TaxID=77166 RepID=U4UW54_DENPD|nr:hypothetical protein D910_11737 [Dendroctonus ponderosae]